MNKLDDQLKASRQTEIPGLRPPVGGWDAVKQQLPTVAPTPPGKLLGGGSTLPYYWLLGAAVLLMVSISSLSDSQETKYAETIDVEEYVDLPETAPASSLTQEQEKANELSTQVPLTASAVVTSTAETRSSSNDTPTKEATSVQSVRSVVRPTLPVSDLNDEENALQLAAKEELSQIEKEASSASVSGSDAVNEKFSEEEDRNLQVLASDVKPASTELSRGEEVTLLAVEAASAPVKDMNAELTSGTAPTTVPETVDGIEAEKASKQGATSSLPFSLAMPLSTAANDLQLPIIATPDHPGFRRSGKPKARAETQVHFSLMGYNSNGYENSRFYDRDISAGGGDRLFVLPNGEPFNVELLRTDLPANRNQSIHLGFGINRQASSGFVFRLSAGLYYRVDGRTQNNFGQVMGTEVREDFYLREVIVPLEIGLQYTFLKRHRFRPYLGVNMVTYLAYSGVERRSFFDAQTQTEGLIGQLSSQGVNFGEFDLSLTTGFQYKLTSRWSVGLSLSAHSQGLYFLEAPFGVEVRRSLK